MEYKKVTGVLVYNNKTRDKAIKLKKSKVPQWSGLTDYTYYVEQDLGKTIYGFTPKAILTSKYASSFFSDSEVNLSVIRDIDVREALSGSITTNPDNDLYDSPLGTYSNKIYACLLYNNALKNDKRDRGNTKTDNGYITPSMYKVYGNNSDTLYTLSELLNVPEGEKRIIKDLSPDANIVRNGINVNDLGSYDNTRVYTLYNMLQDVKKYYTTLDESMTDEAIAYNGKVSENRYYPFIESDEKYLNTSSSKDGYSIDFKNARFDDFNEDGTPKNPVNRTVGHGDKIASERVYLEWGEKDIKGDNNYVPTNEENISDFGYYENNISNSNNLLAKTNKLFNNHKIGTMVARFHSSNDNNYNLTPESFDSAKDTVAGFGNPHGRGLFKLGAKLSGKPSTNGYSDPYCRSWTYHYQYSRFRHGMRTFFGTTEKAFGEEDINIRYRSRFPAVHYTKQSVNRTVTQNKDGSWETESSKNLSDYTPTTVDKGGVYLEKNTVLQHNGLVKITPTTSDFANVIGSDGNGNYDVISASADASKKGANVKKYMFSIENLAWADSYSSLNTRNLSYSQRGPNNGRIMWFPPYNLNFKESVKANWNPNSFVGRGEKVYTYMDTERHGTLSFTLLIDHPAILNSLTNYTGASPDNDPEGDVLRFFAGCQVIDPDKPYRSSAYDPKDEEVYTEENTINGDAVAVELDPNLINGDESISFNVYYPNNYSGNMGIKNFARAELNYEYWVGGDVEKSKDKQKTMEEILEKAKPKLEAMTYGCLDEGWYNILLFGKNGTGDDGNGYEMHVPTSDEDNNFTKDIKHTEPKPNKKEFINDAYIKKYGEKLGVKELTSSNIFYGITDLSSDNTIQAVNEVPKNADFSSYDNCVYGDKDAYKLSDSRFFYYPVDGDLNQGGIGNGNAKTVWVKVNGKFPTNTGYLDLTSWGLNVSTEHQGDDKGDYSFAEFIAAMDATQTDGKNFSDGTLCGEILAQIEKKNSGNSNLLNNVKENIKVIRTTCANREIASIYVKGCASEKNIGNSKTLATRRMITAMKTAQLFIEKFQGGTISANYDKKCESEVKKGTKETGNNTIGGKQSYMAKVIIKFKKSKDDVVGNGSPSIDTSKIEIDDSGKPNYVPSQKDTKNNAVAYKALKNYSDDYMADLYTSNRRYDDEYRFFRDIKEDDPFAFKSIINKVKYFNPAFHSITPEGFNSRLTFLHQCTRQGHTQSASENTNMGATAGNLAFGKMPVCVLRIGDFINSRVIIDSLNIDYQNGDSMQWDLNPEGIGVQPMFANVSLNLTLLGGQSLNAPISRLQNAVTFDYYANAGVYDDRADRAEYEGNGVVNYTNIFTPIKKNYYFNKEKYDKAQKEIQDAVKKEKEGEGKK